MRTFSDLEQKIIFKLIELHDKPSSLNVLNNVLAFLYSDGLPDFCYIEIKSPSDVSIRIMESALNSDSGSFLQEIEDDLFKKLILITALFDYLESEKLVYLVGDYDVTYLGINSEEDEDYIRCDFVEPVIMKRIYRYARSRIYVTETLKTFAQNGFKSDTELLQESKILSARSQLKITRIALVVTFLGLLASVLIPFFGTSKVRFLDSNWPIEIIIKEGNDVGAISERELQSGEEDLEQNKRPATVEQLIQARPIYETGKELEESLEND